MNLIFDAMTLPEAFIQELSAYLSNSEKEEFLHALTDTVHTTCIRMNAEKGMTDAELPVRSDDISSIGWNQLTGRYLSKRPNFTTDPLLHAGCYYVQEASSQFITHVIRSLVHEPITALDLCAAPGGKSTALLSSLPAGSQMVSNEIDRRRARILSENITKWGAPDITVTGNAPKDFCKLHSLFDVILADVPCSGEGMFRKDEGAIKDWSIHKMNDCASLQREIIDTIWPCLKPGGLLIYSTCTFNVHENEENVAWICETLGGQCLEVPVDEDWHIHPPLIGNRPCYRFMPHYTQGEGLFMACIRKDDDKDYASFDLKKAKGKSAGSKGKTTHKIQLPKINANDWVNLSGTIDVTPEGTVRLIPSAHQPLHDALVSQGLFMLQSGIELGTIKGKDLIPAHALALSTALRDDAFPRVELDLETALNYLRRDTITLPVSTPTGYILVCYQGHPIGFVKNMGNRSNNLYPQEWRIRFL